MAVVVEASALCWGFFCVIIDTVLRIAFIGRRRPFYGRFFYFVHGIRHLIQIEVHYIWTLTFNVFCFFSCRLVVYAAKSFFMFNQEF